mgnify:CR=1 FL=1
MINVFYTLVMGTVILVAVLVVLFNLVADLAYAWLDPRVSFTERVFQLPGSGKYFIEGALNRDYTLVMGVVILYAGLIILLNLFADVIYRLLDPKVRYD